MGLLNVSHSTMTQSVIDLQSDLLKNPFYLFNDKKGIPVDYYNLSTTRTTLDPALKIQYADHGEESPLRFNLVHDLYIYGLDRIALNLENGDFGVTASEISGDGIILPDTITPYPGDNFVIPMIKGQRYQFSVTSVSTDTFDNGGNYWRIEYTLDHLSDHELTDLVDQEYNFVSGNVGTNYTPVLLKTKFDVCKELDEAAMNLKRFYKGLYYNDKVQTYTFLYLYKVAQASISSDYFYDPYCMEFIIKNGILSNTGDKYDFVDHKTNLSPDFTIKYFRSIWKVLETCEKDELPGCKYMSSATYINDPATIFGTRYENYFELNYSAPNPVLEKLAPAINILDPQIIGHILDNQIFMSDSCYAKYNMLIKYFNHEDIGVEDIIPFEKITESENNMENFFLIPMIIFIMEKTIKNLMARIPEKELHSN